MKGVFRVKSTVANREKPSRMHSVAGKESIDNIPSDEDGSDRHCDCFLCLKMLRCGGEVGC